jgi:DNA-binding GntR family transcriptional regulator
LVCAAPNRGAVVRTYTEQDLVDMYEIRALLEGFAAHQAALRISAEQLAILAESCDRFKSLRKAHDLNGLIRENIFFHGTIVEAAGTTKLAELVRLAVDLPLIYRSFYWFTDKETQLSERTHREIVKELAAGDAEGAERLMKTHISFGRDFLVARLHAGALNGVQQSETKRHRSSTRGSTSAAGKGRRTET